jgi:hypothetical protein
MTTNRLHIHAQPGQHDEAWLTGDRAGLLALRDAIDAALAAGTSAAEIMPGDGEGYTVVVECLPDDHDWQHEPMGYTEDDLRDDRDGDGPWARQTAAHWALARAAWSNPAHPES